MPDLATLRLLRAEAFIAEHLCDAQLDGDAVARHLSVSPRHLNRLFEQHGEEITDLEVRRASLEDTYIAMVQRFESGDRTTPALAEVTR